ncbi:MAG: hypothetical protein AAF531_10475 [Actinomycetota bacterium]
MPATARDRLARPSEAFAARYQRTAARLAELTVEEWRELMALREIYDVVIAAFGSREAAIEFFGDWVTDVEGRHEELTAGWPL